VSFREVGQVRQKSDLAAQQIIEAIRCGEYVAGDRLPPERELAAELGVSRGCVREAVAALEMTGVLQSRVGDGTYVSRSEQDELARDIVFLVKEGVDLLEIWRAKEELELQLLRSAVVRATEEEVGRLASILGEMTVAVRRRDYQQYLLSNVRFHTAIARAARESPGTSGAITASHHSADIPHSGSGGRSRSRWPPQAGASSAQRDL